MNITYVNYEERFKDEVIDMCMKLYLEDPEGEPMSISKISNTLTYANNHPGEVSVRVITEGDEIAGYAILVPFYSNEHGGNIINIDEMYIKPQYRGCGLATEFINLLKRERDIIGIALETTPSNNSALKLYQRLGFEVQENTHMLARIK